jgi:hypothetical protein
VSEVLYAAPRANLPADPNGLADLAIASAEAKAGEIQRDGISYLINAKKNGIVTPMMDAYEKAVLERTNQPDLKAAFQRLREKPTQSAIPVANQVNSESPITATRT